MLNTTIKSLSKNFLFLTSNSAKTITAAMKEENNIVIKKDRAALRSAVPIKRKERKMENPDVNDMIELPNWRNLSLI